MRKTAQILAIVIMMCAADYLVESQNTSQSTKAPEAKKEYFVFLFTPGPTWIKGKTIFEQPLEKHFQYMQKLISEKTLILGGPFTDNSGAMGVLEAPSLQAAKDIMENDPTVREKLFNVTIHPWLVAVPGCAERKN